MGLQEERTNAYSTECKSQLSLLNHLISITSAWLLGAVFREYLSCKLGETGSKRVARESLHGVFWQFADEFSCRD